MYIQVEADAIDQVLTGCESTELIILEPGAAATATATPTPALPHLKRYFKKVIASNKMLPKSQEAITWWEA